ncbi:hypothetical protein [Mycobacterium sp. 48b]|uniref:hypothetical protein n=1 Tax=Mycobacterium sp. 48b TaxID=3400426 RepID=UPI003AAC6720
MSTIIGSTRRRLSDDTVTAEHAEGSIDAAAEALSKLRVLVEQADADAAEAEAEATAARARARAVRLREQVLRIESGLPAVLDETASEQDVDDTPAPTVTVWWRRRPSRRTVIVSVLIVVLIAVWVAIGYMFWRHQHQVADQQRAAQYVAAAEKGVMALTSLDFNHAADGVQQVLNNATGEFRDEFRSRADDFTKVVLDSKVVTQGTVHSAALQSMTDDSAVVLVAATSQVTNTEGAQKAPRAWRLSVTVSRDGNDMKLSKVEFVP